MSYVSPSYKHKLPEHDFGQTTDWLCSKTLPAPPSFVQPCDELMHLSSNALTVARRLPNHLHSLGPAEIHAATAWQIEATIFQDFVPLEVQVCIYASTSPCTCIALLRQVGVADIVRFRALVREVAQTFGVEGAFAQHPIVLEEDCWSNEDDYDGDAWTERIAEVFRDVADPATTEQRR